MKNKLVALSLLALSIVLVQCKKDEDENPSTAPTVSIISPETGKTFMSMDMLPMEVQFNDPMEMHNYSVTITNESKDSVIYSQSGHQHGMELNFRDTLMLMVHDHSDMKMVAAVTNHLGEEAKDSVSFHVHPMGGHGISK
jgi:hypothetical protein